MYYGFYYGSIITSTTVVPPAAPTTPIAAPSVTNEPEPTDHVAESIERLLEQFKP